MAAKRATSRDAKAGRNGQAGGRRPRPSTRPAGTAAGRRKSKASAGGRRTASRKPRIDGLNAEQVGQIGELAVLGQHVSVIDAARILGLSVERLEAWIASPEGQEVWARERSRGRAELVAAVRVAALAGDVSAQKLLASLLERDDTLSLGQQRISAAEAQELIGRSGVAIRQRVPTGEMIPLGADNRYPVGEFFRLIGRLWDLLATTRKELDDLQRATAASRVEEAEARRRLAVAQAERRERENRQAAGDLVEAAAVHDQLATLATCVRAQSANLVEEIRLKLGLDSARTQMVEEIRLAYLRRVAGEMGAG